MQARIVQFVAAALMLAALMLVPATLVGGADGLVAGLAAFGLTFVPSLLTLLWAGLTFRAAPDMLLLAGMGGSAVRLVVALGGGLALARADPVRFGTVFLLGLAVFYLLLLALEIVLLVHASPTDPRTSA